MSNLEAKSKIMKCPGLLFAPQMGANLANWAIFGKFGKFGQIFICPLQMSILNFGGGFSPFEIIFLSHKSYSWFLVFSILCSASPFQLSKDKQTLFTCLVCSVGWLHLSQSRISCNDLAIFQESFDLWFNIGKKITAEMHLASVKYVMWF